MALHDPATANNCDLITNYPVYLSGGYSGVSNSSPLYLQFWMLNWKERMIWNSGFRFSI